MANIKDPDALFSWLLKQPQSFSYTFAARNALRVLPLIVCNPANRGSEVIPNVLLASFRAASIAHFAGIWPKAITGEIVSAASNAASVAFRTAVTIENRVAKNVLSAAGAAAGAVYDVEDFARCTCTAGNGLIEAVGSISAVTSTDYDDTFMWENVDNDMKALIHADYGGTADERVARLADERLWHRGVPEIMENSWSFLKSSLPANSNWRIWTEWYEARLKGGRSEMELERSRILIADEDWKQGPAHVNTIIVKRLH